MKSKSTKLDALYHAEVNLLDAYGLKRDDIANLIGLTQLKGVDYSDIFIQSNWLRQWSLQQGQIKHGQESFSRGAGVRVNAGEQTGFAYTEDLNLPVLVDAARTASAIASRHQKNTPVQIATQSYENTHLYPIYPASIDLSASEFVDLLHDLDQRARKEPRVVEVMTNASTHLEIVLIANSDGILQADVRPLIKLGIQVVAEQNKRREVGFAGGGGRLTARDWLMDKSYLQWADEAVDIAIKNLDSVPAQAGKMPVVLASGWPGIMLHEAVGHGLEGDFNRKKTSIYSDRIGERVASTLCSVVDNGTLANRRGSLNVDDEGTNTQCNVLIENGYLKGYMQDRHNARLMGHQPTGNGRRESYAHLPMPRMTNTYMLPGESDPEEIIASVDQGLYAVNFGGGQVDITSGNFVFTTTLAYKIENGQITTPVKGATLTGNGPEVLNQVSMVGSDLKLDSGLGTCGKDGQSVPVGVGQPTLKLDEIVVGGAQL